MAVWTCPRQATKKSEEPKKEVQRKLDEEHARQELAEALNAAAPEEKKHWLGLYYRFHHTLLRRMFRQRSSRTLPVLSGSRYH